ncbi:putative metallo-hydrolase [Pseudovibrio sp. W64]|uniref:MBL fold metallo-hydrolase n=1 Tax=unclassified Pseudovibrio TaxID=2627060 RepID=UPI0007AE4917|nr:MULTISPECIES: MBL fold metallo-hydrolase [unclassified Pseudovibrio]KZK77837.1 putative metallo-hydrolase [Pseudovibrio sp. W64]KZK95714.1 putative metallo-hydrolase [Pseudovibrio sp. Ad46]KZL16037.1 putative metallo-hydrolase [Pseudovibrio sp. Ad26]
MERIPAQKWYRTTKLADDITLIDEPYIKQFYRCNIWHVRGRHKDLLVDSGMGVVSLRQHVALTAEKSVMAVASHTHFDHIGCHHEFPHRLIHIAEADLLAHPTRQNTLADPYATDDIFDALPPEPYKSSEYAVKPAPASHLLEDGEVLTTGDRHFEVIHTPGHSPGGIALWEKATETLIAGDIVYDGPLVTDCYHSNMADYIASMKRLLDIPVRTIHGGHFPSFDGERLHEIIYAFLKEHDK